MPFLSRNMTLTRFEQKWAEWDVGWCNSSLLPILYEASATNVLRLTLLVGNRYTGLCLRPVLTRCWGVSESPSHSSSRVWPSAWPLPSPASWHPPSARTRDWGKQQIWRRDEGVELFGAGEQYEPIEIHYALSAAFTNNKNILLISKLFFNVDVHVKVMK